MVTGQNSTRYNLTHICLFRCHPNFIYVYNPLEQVSGFKILTASILKGGHFPWKYTASSRDCQSI